MLDKPPKRRYSHQYRTWMRARIDAGQETCPICGETAEEGHHEGPGGMGRKPDDFWMVPICKRCHRMDSITAWTDLFREKFDRDEDMETVWSEIRCRQWALLHNWSWNELGLLPANPLDPYSVENLTACIENAILFIEKWCPEVVQYREKATRLGQRQPTKKRGTRPLTKTIGGK